MTAARRSPAGWKRFKPLRVLPWTHAQCVTCGLLVGSCHYATTLTQDGQCEWCLREGTPLEGRRVTDDADDEG